MKDEFEKNLDKFKAAKFSPTKEITYPTPILKLKGVPICTPGNISNIQGPAKSAKSSVMGAAIASVLRALLGKGAGSMDETLGFTCELKANDTNKRRHVLHFDTEQSSYHHHKLCLDILARAGVSENESRGELPFHSYSMVTVDSHMREAMIRHRVQEITKQHPGDGIACLFLDGVADIIADPNNAEESFRIVDWLHGLAETHHCSVITVLHENPGKAGDSGNAVKTRGHLGSQITRKSETNLRVNKDEDTRKKTKGNATSQDNPVSVIWIERARGAHIPQEGGVRISWCSRKKRHTIHDFSKQPKKAEPSQPTPEPPRSSKLTKKQQMTKEWLEKTALKDPRIHKELCSLVMRRESCSERTAKGRIKKWTNLGWIHKQPGAANAPYAFGPAPVEDE